MMSDEQELKIRKLLESDVIYGLGLGGIALRKIKEEKLYKATHSSFNKYVKDIFGKSRAWAYRVCADATLIGRLKKEYPDIELNSYQARTIDQCEPELRPELMQRLSNITPLTSTKIIEETHKLRSDVVQMLNALPPEPTSASLTDLTTTLDELKVTGAIELADGEQQSINVIKAVGVSLTEIDIERHNRHNQYKVDGAKKKTPDEQLMNKATGLVKLFEQQGKTSIMVDENTTIILIKPAKVSKMCTKLDGENVQNVHNFTPLTSLAHTRARLITLSLLDHESSDFRDKDLKDKRLSTHISYAKEATEICSASAESSVPEKSSPNRKTKVSPQTKTPQSLITAVHESLFPDGHAWSRAGKLAKVIYVGFGERYSLDDLITHIKAFPAWYKARFKGSELVLSTDKFPGHFATYLTELKNPVPEHVVWDHKTDPLAVRLR